jgi:hypothetical protein
VVDGEIVVTSTLAFPAKAFAVHRDPRVALLAGGWLVQGSGRVAADLTSEWFDRHLRAQELEKYPPARSLLAIPGHRRWFAWYVARVVVTFDDLVVTRAADASDRVTVTRAHDGALRIDPLAADLDVEHGGTAPLELDGCPDGPVDVLIHEEHRDFAQLGQLHARGDVHDGRLVAPEVSGSLTPAVPGAIGQLRQLRRLGRGARRHEARAAALPSLSSGGAR